MRRRATESDSGRHGAPSRLAPRAVDQGLWPDSESADGSGDTQKYCRKIFRNPVMARRMKEVPVQEENVLGRELRLLPSGSPGATGDVVLICVVEERNREHG